MASTPAMKVVDTAPIPGIKTPSLPSAGAIRTFSVIGKTDMLLFLEQLKDVVKIA
jgi:hypothetical protein